MSASQKFSFDRVFTRDGGVSEPAPRPRRSYRADEVEALKAESYKAGENSALAKTEEAAAQSLSVLAAGIQDVLNTLRAELDLIKDDSTRLAAYIAHKFVSKMIETAPELYLERCIDECLEVVHREPGILIVIPAESPPSIRAHLEKLARERGLEVAMKIEESPSLQGVSCRLTWQSGGAEITLEDALTQIDQLIEDHIASLGNRAEAPAQQATA